MIATESPYIRGEVLRSTADDRVKLRRAWDVCAGIVSTMSSRFEPSGRPDPRFVWVGTRALYMSDTPTGVATPETTAALAVLRKQRRRVGSGQR